LPLIRRRSRSSGDPRYAPHLFGQYLDALQGQGPSSKFGLREVKRRELLTGDIRLRNVFALPSRQRGGLTEGAGAAAEDRAGILVRALSARLSGLAGPSGEIVWPPPAISLPLLGFAWGGVDEGGVPLPLLRFAGRRSGEDGALAGVLSPETDPEGVLLALKPRSADRERLRRATLGSFGLEGSELAVLKSST
jgi:hypothetical protein